METVPLHREGRRAGWQRGLIRRRPNWTKGANLRSPTATCLANWPLSLRTLSARPSAEQPVRLGLRRQSRRRSDHGEGVRKVSVPALGSVQLNYGVVAFLRDWVGDGRLSVLWWSLFDAVGFALILSGGALLCGRFDVGRWRVSGVFCVSVGSLFFLYSCSNYVLFIFKWPRIWSLIIKMEIAYFMFAMCFVNNSATKIVHIWRTTLYKYCINVRILCT